MDVDVEQMHLYNINLHVRTLHVSYNYYKYRIQHNDI